jgi:DNA-binding LytR/AlgR family response regulator
MTRALIADDETLMREQLRARLAEAWPELQIVAEARDGREAVELTAKHRPEVVFLDIRMPAKTGIEAAREIAALPGPAAHIVFVTAYDQYAIDAFEHGVIDYVLKPAERKRLAVTVERLRSRLKQTPGDQSSVQQALARLAEQLGAVAPPAYLKWIQASVGEQIHMIATEDVLFFVSDEKYTRVQTAQQGALIRTPIKELIAELDPAQFWQIHRSTVINVRAIAGISRDFRGRQLVSIKGSSEKLEVSRSYAHLFKGM